MTKDIAPELIATISTEFQKKMAGSSKIKSLDAKIRNRTATYRDAQEYAIKVSELMSEALLSNLSADMLQYRTACDAGSTGEERDIW